MNGILKKDLSLVAWNANGVGPKHSNLLEFLVWFKLNKLLLSDSHLTPAN